MSIRFTVGMAVYDVPAMTVGGGHEHAKLRMAVMDLLIHHPLADDIVIVDNNPFPRNLIAELGEKSGGRVRYIEYPRPQGTAPPRNHIFAVAKHEHVVVMDSHVILYPGCLEALDSVYSTCSRFKDDLFHGPMMNEDGSIHATHMDPVWREGMLGIWEVDQKQHDERTPFEIPGHGMGFFACRKDAWLPFHRDCRGFGGEEITTAWRFQKAGRKVWCVPGAKWWHDFGKFYSPYRHTQWDKIRNYVLEFRALGLDLGPIYEHFIKPHPEWEGEWKQILAGKTWPTQTAEAGRIVVSRPGDLPPDADAPPAPVPMAMPPESGSADVRPSDAIMNAQYPLAAMARQIRPSVVPVGLARLAAMAQNADVVELGTGTAWTTAQMLLAKPQSLITYDTRIDGPHATMLKHLVPRGTLYRNRMVPDFADAMIPGCDILVVHSREPGDEVPILAAHESKVRRAIVVLSSSATMEGLKDTNNKWTVRHAEPTMVIMNRAKNRKG